MDLLFPPSLSTLEAGILASLPGGFAATTAGALPVFVLARGRALSADAVVGRQGACSRGYAAWASVGALS